MSRVVGVVGGIVWVYFQPGNPQAWAFLASQVYGANEDRKVRRDRRRAVAAYNASQKDRLEMALYDAYQARTLVMGRTRHTEGRRGRFIQSGTNLEKLSFFVSIAGHEIDAIEKIYINDDQVTTDGSGWVQPTAVGTASGYTTNGSALAIGATSIPLISGTGTFVAGDWVQVAGDSTRYQVATGISAPGTLVLAAPGLRRAVAASATAVTLYKAPYSKTVRSGASNTGTADGSGNCTITLSSTPVAGSAYATYSLGSGQSQVQGTPSMSLSGTTATITGAQAGSTVTVAYEVDTTTSSVRLRPYLGTDTQSVATDVASEYGGKMRSTDHYRGMAGWWVDLTYDPDVFPQGIPTLSAVLRGAKVYDPRKDSTNGGSGAHRLATKSTWEWSECPELHLAHWARWYAGGALPDGDIPWAEVAAEATACDASTTFTLDNNGSTSTVSLPLYRCGIAIPSDMDHQAALDAICETMAGRWAWFGGQLRSRAGRMRTPAVTIDETWVMQTLGPDGEPEDAESPVRGTLSIARENRINRVTGRFTDPDQRYQQMPFPAVQDDTLVAARGLRPTEVEYEGVNHLAHAGNLARIAVREAQAGFTLDLQVGLRALKLEMLDVATVNLPRYGISGKTCELVRFRPSLGRPSRITLREITAAIFDPSATLDGRDPAPDSNLRPVWQLPAIAGLAVTSGATAQTDGSILVRTEVSWTAVADEAIRKGGEVEIQYTEATGTVPSGDWASVTERGTATKTVIAGLLGGRFYLFKARTVQHGPEVKGTWSAPVRHQISDRPQVDSGGLVDGAASVIATADQGGAATLHLTETDIITITIDSGGKPILLSASVTADGSYSARSVTFKLKMDGVAQLTRTFTPVGDSSSPGNPWDVVGSLLQYVIPSPTTGTRTIKLTATGSDAVYGVNVYNCNLYAEAKKK